MILFKEGQELRSEIKKLKKEIIEERERTARALKKLFLLQHKPKYKTGQNVWFSVYSGYGCYNTINGVIVLGYAEQTYNGEVAYFYKCVDINGHEYSINELSIYKTKP